MLFSIVNIEMVTAVRTYAGKARPPIVLAYQRRAAVAQAAKFSRRRKMQRLRNRLK
jgi:hypothetical protein